jgi:hypothetical protein
MNPHPPDPTADNILVVGGKGTGKTYVLKAALAECMARGRAVVVLDSCDEYRMPGEIVLPGDNRIAQRLAGALVAVPRGARVRIVCRYDFFDTLNNVAHVLHHVRNITLFVDEIHAYVRALTAPPDFELFARMETGPNHRGSNFIAASQLPDIPVSIRCSVHRVGILTMSPEFIRKLYKMGVVPDIPVFPPARAPAPRGYLGFVRWY